MILLDQSEKPGVHGVTARLCIYSGLIGATVSISGKPKGHGDMDPT